MTVVELLNRYIEALRKKNPRVSLRLFSKKVGISPGRMSELLAGKRPLTSYYAERIAGGLHLSIEQTKELHSLVSTTGRKLATGRILKDAEIQILSSWEYYAILNLLNLDNSKGTAEDISRRLGLTLNRTTQCLKVLEDGYFIERQGPKYKRVSRRLDTSHDIPSKALRDFQAQHIMKSLEALEKVSVDKRDFSTITMPANPKNLKKAKKLISRFQDRMALLMEEGEKTEVYDLTIQFFPLSSKNGSI